jgi:hypothetical protein
LLQGGEFITARAREMVSGGLNLHSSIAPPVKPPAEKLKKSTLNTPEDIDSFTQKFDEGLKRVFSEAAGTYFVEFGGPRDNDPKYGIKGGRLTLTG